MTGQPNEALKRKPILGAQESSYLAMFALLSASRPRGEGFQPIPLSEVKAYLDIYKISPLEDREDVLLIIKELDMKLEELTKK